MSLPILLTLGYFAVRGGLPEFIYFNWTLNAGWVIQFSPAAYLRELFTQNRLMVGLSLIGVLGMALRMFGRKAFRRGDYVLVVNGIGLFAGLFLIPVPHRQYYLMFLPLMALYAATAMIDAVDLMAARLKQAVLRDGRLFFFLNALLLATIAAIIVWGLPENPRAPMRLRFTLLIGSLGIAWAIIHVLYGLRSTALAILMIAASIYPLKQIHAAFHSTSNDAQLRNVRYVLENTAPEEIVMDGQGG